MVYARESYFFFEQLQSEKRFGLKGSAPSRYLGEKKWVRDGRESAKQSLIVKAIIKSSQCFSKCKNFWTCLHTKFR